MTRGVGSIDRSRPTQRHYKQVRRTILFSFRITEAESYLLAEAAELDGRPVTEIVRRRVFGPMPPLRGLERFDDAS